MQQYNTKTSSGSLFLFSDVHTVLHLACLTHCLTSVRNVGLLSHLCQYIASHPLKEHRSAEHQNNQQIFFEENKFLSKLHIQCWENRYLVMLSFVKLCSGCFIWFNTFNSGPDVILKLREKLTIVCFKCHIY